MQATDSQQTLTSGLTTNSYRRVSSGQASSCHSEPKGWGPLRLYLFNLCIALCTTAHSDSHYSQLLPITLQVDGQPALLMSQPSSVLHGTMAAAAQTTCYNTNVTFINSWFAATACG
jgi:hypothetical protein